MQYILFYNIVIEIMNKIALSQALILMKTHSWVYKMACAEGDSFELVAFFCTGRALSLSTQGPGQGCSCPRAETPQDTLTHSEWVLDHDSLKFLAERES